MRLVEHSEFAHQALVEFRVLKPPAVPSDAEAEKPRIVQIRLRKIVVAKKGLVLLLVVALVPAGGEPAASAAILPLSSTSM
jgi:uncharacterized protein involved in cysteine biosynthesis